MAIGYKDTANFQYKCYFFTISSSSLLKHITTMSSAGHELSLVYSTNLMILSPHSFSANVEIIDTSLPTGSA